MKNNLKYSTLFVAVFSILVLIPVHNVLAAPSIITNNTTANVTEVKAVRTLTVATAVASSTALSNPKTIVIGNCTVSFATTTNGTARIGTWNSTVDELVCSDGVARILLATTTNDRALSIAEIAQELRGLKFVSDDDHGNLAVTAGAGNTIVFTATTTETSETNIVFTDGTGSAITGVSPTTAVKKVAQVSTFSIDSPSMDRSYDYNIIIQGTTYTHRANNESTTTIATALTTSMIDDSNVTCTSSYGVITCTAKTAGTAFSYSTSANIVAVTAPSGSGSGRHSSGGGGGGGGMSSVALQNAGTGAGAVISQAARIEAIKSQINSLLQLVQRLQQKLLRMQGL